MTVPYPIVSQSMLAETPRRGPWGLGGQRRLNGELPRLNPHEVLVYRAGGHFIVDDGRRRPDDSQVVNATSVSVVNMRRDADVEATFTIASKDAAQFAVQVNFVCSVVDAVTVVRDGQTNASEALLAYLKGYQPLFELGLDHPLAEINAVRREAGFHVKAYMTLKPPQIAGMSIALANVQVMTPGELAEYEERRRKEERERILAAERLAGEQSLKQRQQEGEQSLIQRQQDGEQLLKHRQQEGEQLLDLRRQDFSLKQAERVGEAVNLDPRQALLLAHIRGEVSADDYAQRLRLLAEEDRQRAWEAKQAKRLAREKADEIAREDAKERAALEQADKQRELEWDRADRLRKIEFRRAMAEREADEARERRKQEVEAELEILREFNKRGLLDNYYPDINEMMRRIRGEAAVSPAPTAQVAQGEAHAELPSAENNHSTEDLKEEDLKEDDLREEDDD